jgi:hypothetical protein
VAGATTAARAIAGIVGFTMVVVQLVTGADERHHSFFAYDGFFAVCVSIVILCCAPGVGWRIRYRRLRQDHRVQRR